MIIRATNQDKNFYSYMGKFFGSRVVEKQTSDRLYDDNNKLWYIYLDGKKPMAFVSVAKNIIKNVYADVYERCGYKIDKSHTYKNFVTIYL